MVRRESLFRLQGCSDNQLDSSECSSPKMEEIEQCSHVLQTTPSNKRKSSPRVSGSVVVGMMDLDSYDASRPPLSPLQYNSPESRMHKK